MDDINAENGLPKASSVAQYIDAINTSLLSHGGRVKGEITSISPSGKAVYFKIKDKDEPAILDCLMWLSIYQRNGLDLKIGDEVIVTGTPEIYAPYGKFSLKATTVEYAGEGALKQAYDKLKASLEGEGLMEVERKRPMPSFPTKIGLITSMSGVVIQDFSANLSRHGFKIKTVDSRVEGKDAIHDLLAAINTLSKQDIEILVIIRGGGSLESLQAFNTESVVRAIAEFKVPVITGIGHDVDVTLSELVADIGKSTPTAVAEAFNEPWDGQASELKRLQTSIVSSYKSELHHITNKLSGHSHGLMRSYERSITEARNSLTKSGSEISSAFSLLAKRVRDANGALLRSLGIMKTNLSIKYRYLRNASGSLLQYSQSSVRSVRKSLSDNGKYLISAQSSAIKYSSKSIPLLERAVHTNDPRRNIKLGYSLSYVNGKLARSVSDVAVGQEIVTHLHDGEFKSEVKEV